MLAGEKPIFKIKFLFDFGEILRSIEKKFKEGIEEMNKKEKEKKKCILQI